MSYRDIANGLVTVLEANVTGLKAFAYPPDTVNHFPCAVILPEPVDTEIAFQGNTYEAAFRVIILVASGDVAEGFIKLYDLLDPTLANKSIIAAVRADQTLNSTCDSSDVTRLENIGRREHWGNLYFGFDAIVSFIKTVS